MEDSGIALEREYGDDEKGNAVTFDLSIPPVRTWQRNGAAVFCRTRDEWGEFSNMHNRFGYEDGGLFWKSTEAQYQAGAFSHLPEHQNKIRQASHAHLAKQVAYERVSERCKNWQPLMNVAMMAYVLSKKADMAAMQPVIARVGTMPIIELSTRDDFWGAKPRGDVLVGRNMLGVLWMQACNGARMRELPEGISFDALRALASAPPAQSDFFFARRSENRFG